MKVFQKKRQYVAISRITALTMITYSLNGQFFVTLCKSQNHNYYCKPCHYANL